MTSSHDVKYPRELAGPLLPVMMDRGKWSLVVQQIANGDPMGETQRCAFEVTKPLPSEDALAQILDLAYVTSLYAEEGRACALTVAYVSPMGATQLGHGTFTFSSPLSFEPSQLR